MRSTADVHPSAGGITVVGGCYRERCNDPTIDRLQGSGVRAAALLSALKRPARLATYVDESTTAEASAVAVALNFELQVTPRPRPIVFHYATPLALPRISSTPTTNRMAVCAENVLAFGMLEGTPSLEARTLVLDPQGSTLEQCGLIPGAQEHLAIVLNHNEASRITGECDPSVSARHVMSQTLAEVVVVKRGALGATVAVPNKVINIGAHPTADVFPIGSGDAFSAGFSAAWTAGADPFASARFGSTLAAAFCSSGNTQPNRDNFDAIPHVLPGRARSGRVYLAGPFFDIAQRWLLNHVRDALLGLGAEVFSPLHDVGLGNDEVAGADIEGLIACESVLALLDGADSGTLFEVGWATRHRIPIVGYSERPDDHNWTMLRGTGAEVLGDLSTATYRAIWAGLRSEPDNQ